MKIVYKTLYLINNSGETISHFHQRKKQSKPISRVVEILWDCGEEQNVTKYVF
jgi:hypothetical protein